MNGAAAPRDHPPPRRRHVLLGNIPTAIDEKSRYFFDETLRNFDYRLNIKKSEPLDTGGLR
jgi:succinylglutamate desuccinylase